MPLRGILARIAILLTLPIGALRAARPPIQVYSTAMGMPTTSASCIVPDANGLLWICTNAGLVRFDGYRFHVFGPEDGLPSRRIIGFQVSRRGGYWVTTDSGVCRLPPGSKVGDPCRPLTSDGPPGEFMAEGLAELENGTTFLATFDHIFRVSANGRELQPTPLRRDPRFLFVTMAALPDGRLLIGTENSLLLWREGEDPQTIERGRGVRHIRIVSRELAWINAADGLNRLTLPAGRPPRLQRVAPELTGSRCVVVRHDGSVWAGSWRGISRLAPGTGGIVEEAELYSAREGLPAAGIEALSEDRQGNLWGAADGAGIFRIANAGFTTYTRDDVLGNARISSIFEDLAGDLCVTVSPAPTDATGFRIRQGTRFSPVNLGTRPGWGWNQFGFQARNGEWWFPSTEGLFRFAPTPSPADLAARRPVDVYGSDSGLRGNDIFRISEDTNGDVWVSFLGPVGQLARWERRTGMFHHWTSSEGWLSTEVATVIRESSSGTHWIGTFRHVIRFRGGKFELVTPFSAEPAAYVRDVFVDSAGRLWVATARSGLFRCDNPEAASPVFQNYTMRQGLSADSVRSVTEDNAGLLYIGTIRGVDRIDPRVPIASQRIRHFTTADGLPDSEQNVAYRDRKGHLWFGSLNGLAEFDPSVDTTAAPPEVYITRVRSRGADIPLPWEGVRQMAVGLSADRNQVEVEYAGIDLRSVASLRYQYRITGIESAWSEPTDQLSVNYTRLPAGRLGFEVRAVAADGQVSRAVGLALSIQAPVWRRWWFLSLAALLIGAAVSTLYNYRVQQLLAMERLRTRIATDLHDDIGSSLTQISILSELAGRTSSREAHSDVADIARRLVEDMNDIVWAVNPRHDHFEALVHRMRRFAADMLADLDLQFHAEDLPPDLKVPLEYRRPLFLVYKEAVNNVARHARASAATIRIAVEEATLKLAVEDNGRGFDPSVPASGEGLESLRKRVGDLGGTAEWMSAPGRGTRFEAILPLRHLRYPHELGGIFAAFRR